MFMTEGITTCSFSRLKFVVFKALNNSAAAVFPISKAGCVMVVSEGFNKKADCKLEKPITFISSGIANCSLLQTR